MARKNRKPKPARRVKIGKTPLDPRRPIGKGNPPVETQFQPGNQAAVGHTQPRKLADLQALIISTLAEETHDAEGRRTGLTRAQMLIRTMLIKSPSDRIALLEYAFGKMPQAFQHSGPDGGQIQFAQLSERELDDLLAGLFAQVAARSEGAGGATPGGEGAAGGGAGPRARPRGEGSGGS